MYVTLLRRHLHVRRALVAQDLVGWWTHLVYQGRGHINRYGSFHQSGIEIHYAIANPCFLCDAIVDAWYEVRRNKRNKRRFGV